ncbi:MAG: hypothetical protein JJ957_07680 [Pseudomonadales bacterium]|nr:hypothetical protein [Pseudomonadales bacterium]MBO6563804.1 hypothetical protein [Pseudomonadales bacterium]MBO6595708.1 hypothetical protein [Pseudomonadales bacterium]MBO6820734.1 hypothetical protein [Pseudomonadales bacterium]
MKRFIYVFMIGFSLATFAPASWAESELEQVEQQIVKLKRELMDLERLYRNERNGADVEDVPEMTRQYARTSLEINEALRRYEKRKMRIIEKSVNGYLAEERP